MMRDRLSTSMQQVASTFQRGKNKGLAKKKYSLKGWNRFQTVSFPTEEAKDWHLTSAITSKSQTSCCAAVQTRLITWLLPGLIGFLTATSGVLIEKASNRLNGILFGYCASDAFAEPEDCQASGSWVSWWGTGLLENQLWPDYLRGWLCYVLLAAALAGFSATLVRCFAPTARGSGIPEVKTILGGFVMAEVLEFKTLVVKVVGLAFSVSSGMALGKEGPLVHVACCWANFCSKLSPRYMANEGKRRELISTAAAAGVAVAFGAPVGGVLFSYEEVSTMFPQKTMIRAFFAAVVAALTLLWYNPTGTGKLTMFESFVPDMPSVYEYPWFVALGIMGGMLGALFVHWNIKISAGRAEGTDFRKRVPIVAEVAAIAVLTAVTSFPSTYTREMSPVTIRALFHSCEDATSSRPFSPDMMGLCAGSEPMLSMSLVSSLIVAAALRFLQMTITFGTGVPCGLFVPSLYTGACLGRCLGMFVRWLNAYFGFAMAVVHPGVYAMVGAAAVLGGVCRVTISLVVIMYELTSALQLIVPFMLAVLTAKWVGDSFTHGIYDCCIRLRGYPYLHEPDDFTFGTRACDIMDEELECVCADAGSLGDLLRQVSDTQFGGFPLVRSPSDRTLLGYVHTQQVRSHLENLLSTGSVGTDIPVIFGRFLQEKRGGAVDLSKLVDETTLRIVPETPLAQVHNIFRQLGIKIVLVTRFAELAGIITKKSFVHHLETGSIGHITHDPAVAGTAHGPGGDDFESIAEGTDNGAGKAVHKARKAQTLHVRFRADEGGSVDAHATEAPQLQNDIRQSRHRRESLQKMRDMFVSAFSSKGPNTNLVRAGTAEENGLVQRVKKSLKKYNKYTTVSFPTEDAKDFHEHTSSILSKGSRLQKFAHALVPWLIPALVGFLTATVGSLIEVASDWMNSLRFGRCLSNSFLGREACGADWVAWSTSEMQAFASYVVISVAFAAVSAALVRAFAPMARGSGIPEVKTILGGFVMNEVLEFKTLVVKVIGLTLSVSSGMSLGKEGPLVHVACCWANFCSKLSSRYVENEAKRRELISTAAAAGVSVAFGTPLGGVLFSYEEVSTMFPQKTMVRAFFAAVIAALSLSWYNPAGRGRLTMFQTHFVQMPSLAEYPWFLILGAVGGVLGAVFVHFNIKISAARQEGTAFRKRVPIVAEVSMIALVTALTSWPLLFTRGLSTSTIQVLFQGCGHAPEDMDMMGLCAGDDTLISMELVTSLGLAALLRFVQMTFTFGTGVPCGLFVPSLYTGACLGRCLGMFVTWLNGHYHFAAAVDTGVYAMVGAAAVLGGVCRVTISLVVIMFGLTGALQLIVPFMLAVLTAKFVGDRFGDGIYDACIVLRGYPYLHEPDEVSFNARACDIMDDELECINTQPTTLGQLLEMLRKTTFGGFPLISSGEDHTLLGYIHTEPLRRHLEKTLGQSALMREDFPVIFKKYTTSRVQGALDLSKFVDETVVRIVPETPLAQVHNIFRQLGVKLVLVARFGHLAGMITKKGFVDHLHEGHIGHVAKDPVVEGIEPLDETSREGMGEEHIRVPNASAGLRSDPAAPLLEP